jgi:hypothetical protein
MKVLICGRPACYLAVFTALFVLYSTLGAAACAAQRMRPEDVPTTLTETFTVLYPDLRLLHWVRRGENYEAKFRSRSGFGSLLFDRSGNLLEREKDISIDDLPKEAASAAKKQIPEMSITGAGKITDTDGHERYRVSSDSWEVVVDARGKILSKTSLQ